MSDERLSEEIVGQQYDDYWEHMAKDNIVYGDIQTIDNQRLKDLSIIKHDYNGKIKFKKRNNKKGIIKVGDKINNDGEHGEVIDIDGNLLCVKTKDGEIKVWNINNVKKVDEGYGR